MAASATTPLLPLLAVWERNDPYFHFRLDGAEALRHDLRAAQIKFLNTGHFALETYAREIATEVRTFLAGVLSAPVEHSNGS